MKNKQIMAVVALMIVGLVAASAMAFGFGRSEEVHTAMTNNDFAGWKEAMMADLTQERFDQMRNGYQQREQHRLEWEEHHEEMEAAIEQGYDAFAAAIKNNPREHRMLSYVTEDNFAIFQQMHQARDEGDFETTGALAEELGMPMTTAGGCMGLGGRIKWH